MRWLWPGLILVLLCSIYFADILSSGLVFAFRDLSRYYYPLRGYAVSLMQSGTFPFWNPYVAGGHPLFAGLQSVVLYPLSIIYYCGNFDAAFNLFIIIHVFLGGLFFYLLMRGLRFEKSAALIAAVVFSFSGYLIAVINLTTTLAAAIWFPLVFLFYHRLLERRKPLYALLTSLFLGVMFLGGEPTPLYATVFLLGLYTLIISKKQRLLGNLLLYFSCVSVFILLFSFQIIPFAELISLSERTCPSFERTTFWSFPPRNIVDCLLPFFHGPLYLQPETAPRQDWLLLCYLGVMPAVLFLLSFIFRRDNLSSFFKLSFIIGLVLIFGKFTPIYKILYQHVPGLGLIRYPVKFFFISAVSFAWLCGAGFSEYQRRAAAREPRLLKVIKGIFVFAFFAAIIFLLLNVFKEAILSRAHIYAEQRAASDEQSLLRFNQTFFANFFNLRRMLVLFILSALLLFLNSRKRLVPALLAFLVIGIIYLDLYGGKNIEINPAVPAATLHAASPNIEILKKDKELFRVYTSYRQNKVNEVLRGNSYAEAMLQSIDNLNPNRPMEHGIYTARGYLSLPQANYSKVLLLADSAPRPSATNVLNMLNVKYILTPEELDDPGCELAHQGTAYLYRNKNALPRAYLVPGYIVLKQEQDIAERLRSLSFNPAKTVILQEEPPSVGRPVPSGEASTQEGVRIVSYAPNEVLIHADVTKAAKFLVLADNFYPGWQVAVDGKKDKIYPANFILRAVRLLPGKHTVRFFYRPASFRIGAVISLFTAFALAVVVFLKPGSVLLHK